jgi:hypothetical protein
LVTACVGAVKVAVPGPESLLHWIVSGPGKPSSLTLPARFADAVIEMVTSGPALTMGGWLTGGAVW